MRRHLFAISLFCVAPPAAPVALAQDACVMPPIPAPVDGASLSEAQMRAAADAARAFITQADMYQSCLGDQLNAARTQANADGKPLDPGLEGDIKSRLATSQSAKEKVGASINVAIGRYKEAHSR